MAVRATIVGVHPINADEPVHLIEMVVEGDVAEFDIGKVTQEIVGRPESRWQAVYDEHVLEQSERHVRYAFFFHYLNFRSSLLSPIGPLKVPKPTEVPPHLHGIIYESP